MDSGAGLVLLTAATGQCMVGRVVPGSPAARGRNVWLGDLIESIDERTVPIGPGSAEAALVRARVRVRGPNPSANASPHPNPNPTAAPIPI
eukprot:scaffold30921_cov58-Phaeocystis_antarctica.AAC.2